MVSSLKKIGLIFLIVTGVLYLTAAYYPIPLPGNAGKVLVSGGTSWTSSNVNLADSDAVGSSVLPIANGGTNKALTLSAGGVPYFDADSFEVLSAGSSGSFLTSGGAGAPTWTTATNSNYTPTLTNVANLDASTARNSQYIRIGSYVVVYGRAEYDVTASATSTSLDISIPVASNFTTDYDLNGVCSSGVAILYCGVDADTANDRANLYISNSSSTANANVWYTFSYIIQ